MRIEFCGVIEGTVTQRPGESKADAILRASDTINKLLGKHARLLRAENHPGPVVGLEPADGMWVGE